MFRFAATKRDVATDFRLSETSDSLPGLRSQSTSLSHLTTPLLSSTKSRAVNNPGKE